MRIPKTDPTWDEVRYRPEPNTSTPQKARNGILVIARRKCPKGSDARANAAAPPPRPSAAAVLPPSPLGKNSVSIKRTGNISNPTSKEREKPTFVVRRAIKVQDPAAESTKATKKGSATTTTTSKTGTKRRQVEEDSEEDDSSDWDYEERGRARHAASLSNAKRDREAADAVASEVATGTSKRKLKADERYPAKEAKRNRSPAPSKKEEMDRSQVPNVAAKKRYKYFCVQNDFVKSATGTIYYCSIS